MRRSFVMLGVAMLAAAPVVFGTVAPAGAQAAAPKLVAVVISGAGAATGPNSNLVPSAAHGRPKYTPKKLKIAHSTHPKCTPAHGGATITNKTSATQTITYLAKPVLTVAPKKVALFCGGGPATFVLGVDGSHSTLTLFFS